MFFSLLRSHDSFFIFLGLGPLDRSSVVSPGSLSSDDIYSTALGDDKISLALALSILEGLCYFQDWRGVLKVSKQMMREKNMLLFKPFTFNRRTAAVWSIGVTITTKYICTM